MNLIKLTAAILIVLFSGQVFSDVDVKGYYRKDGTYVQPSHRSDPDHNKNNNWSTKGNVNPYTGDEGTKPADNKYTEPSNFDKN